MLLLLLVTLRLLNIFAVQTFFVPDEYWQSLEVAHNFIFGIGHLTWEWKVGLRSFIYPSCFSLVFKLLKVTGLNETELLIFLPRACQAIFSACGDWCLYNFTKNNFGKEAGKYTIFFQLTNWFWWYCATRTLINTTELTSFEIGLYFYPLFKNDFNSLNRTLFYMCVAVLLSILRPTIFISWFPIVVLHLKNELDSKYFGKTLLNYITVSVVLLFFTTLVDSIYYGKLTFVPINFIHFNFFTGQSSFYGTHPFHWYLSQGIWVVLGPQFPICLLCFYAAYKRLFTVSHMQITIIRLFIFIIFLNIFVFSLLGHKEFRFIMVVIPLASVLCGFFYANITPFFKKVIFILILIINLPTALYFGLIHQRGAIDIISDIKTKISTQCVNELDNCDVLFLMPCHSTPYYSHVHFNISMKFLECPPNIKQVESYETDEDVFFENPNIWLRKNVFKESFETYKANKIKTSIPKYITFFGSFLNEFSKLEYFEFYNECANIFHTHLPEGKRSKRIYLFCRK